MVSMPLPRLITAALALIPLLIVSGCALSAAPEPHRDQLVQAEPFASDPFVNVRPEPSPAGGTGLVGLTRTGDGYRLTIRGSTRPYLRVEDGALIVDLPGLALHEGVALPPDLTVRQVEPEPAVDPLAGTNSLNATVPTRMPSGGVRLTLPAPKGPYALYRVNYDTLDLRTQPPGLAGKIIVLDPGHGAEESGAIGPGGFSEKDVNLAVARLLRPMLESAGATVIMTRTGNTRADPPDAAGSAPAATLRADLMERANIGNRAGADLFLSIHANGGPEGMGGIETYWTLRNLNASRSYELARLVQEEVVRAYGWENRGVKQRAFSVIRNTEAPAALAELGFLTHPREGPVLVSPWGQELGAKALYRAIERFFAAS